MRTGTLYLHIIFQNHMQDHIPIRRIVRMPMLSPIRSPIVYFHASSPHRTIHLDFRIKEIRATIPILNTRIQHFQAYPFRRLQVNGLIKPIFPNVLECPKVRTNFDTGNTLRPFFFLFIAPYPFFLRRRKGKREKSPEGFLPLNLFYHAINARLPSHVSHPVRSLRQRHRHRPERVPAHHLPGAVVLGCVR